jgi:hypothetical protein
MQRRKIGLVPALLLALFAANPPACTPFPGSRDACVDEICGDGIDNDCDGAIDEADDAADATTYYYDADADGYGRETDSLVSCTQPEGYAPLFGDCDDATAATNPGAEERCDGIDNNCDGDTDGAGSHGAVVWYADADGDRYGTADDTVEACDQPKGYEKKGGDCDDTNADIGPEGREICDGIDNDCDGTIDGSAAEDAVIWYADADGDTWGDADVTLLDCEEPDGYVGEESRGDCDDTRAEAHPGADELCNDLDDDCDVVIDESPIDGSDWYVDYDADGFGDPTIDPTYACDSPGSFSEYPTDCDDRNEAVNPDATEICNKIDDNCNGTIDEGC